MSLCSFESVQHIYRMPTARAKGRGMRGGLENVVNYFVANSDLGFEIHSRWIGFASAHWDAMS